MSNTATVTAKTGPAIQDTAIVLTNVTQIIYNFAAMVVQITSNGLIKDYDLTGVTTITTSISGSSFTVTIS